MALQPAAGVRDLNPREVDRNRRLCDLLADVYRLWGYPEVAPPSIERLDTLEAGGAIDERELVLERGERRKHFPVVTRKSCAAAARAHPRTCTMGSREYCSPHLMLENACVLGCSRLFGISTLNCATRS